MSGLADQEDLRARFDVVAKTDPPLTPSQLEHPRSGCESAALPTTAEVLHAIEAVSPLGAGPIPPSRGSSEPPWLGSSRYAILGGRSGWVLVWGVHGRGAENVAAVASLRPALFGPSLPWCRRHSRSLEGACGRRCHDQTKAAAVPEGVQATDGPAGARVSDSDSARAIERLAVLRAIVAALGERATPPWWRTQFLTEVGLRTVARIVPRTAVPAAVASTSITARTEHDRWIGVGRRFHLFRLPGVFETSVEAALHEEKLQAQLKQALAMHERLVEELASLAGARHQKPTDGPVALGDARQLSKPATTAVLAACYLAAFSGAGRCFPYFEESA